MMETIRQAFERRQKAHDMKARQVIPLRIVEQWTWTIGHWTPFEI